MFIFKVENVESAHLSILALVGFVIETKGLAINMFCRYEAGLFFMPCAYTTDLLLLKKTSEAKCDLISTFLEHSLQNVIVCTLSL